jgi:peptidoglycan hydrolase CwlO-like protein
MSRYHTHSNNYDVSLGDVKYTISLGKISDAETVIENLIKDVKELKEEIEDLKNLVNDFLSMKEEKERRKNFVPGF